MKNFLRDNRGDEQIAKLLLVVTAFVCGAIVLAIVTQALKGPIKTWFDTMLKSWFNDGSNFMKHGTDMNSTNAYTYNG